jgi:hypothetical protein
MGLSTRPSNPAIVAARAAMLAVRDDLVAQWTQWVLARTAGVPGVVDTTLERQFGLLVDILIEVAGPLRRQGAELWFHASDAYGRLAAIRGLAAGEVVEEIQHLRELLIRHLSEAVFSMPARQSMAVLLRLNRIVDKCISHAVVGYTDELVETLLDKRGVPVTAAEPAEMVITERLAQLEDELARLKIDYPS